MTRQHIGMQQHSLVTPWRCHITNDSKCPLVQVACREPALAAYEAEEVLQRGSLAFVSSLASSVANGVFGVAKAAAWGRQAGFRAGPHLSSSTHLGVVRHCCGSSTCIRIIMAGGVKWSQDS